MKRSKISQCIKEMEKLAKEKWVCIVSIFVAGITERLGRQV